MEKIIPIIFCVILIASSCRRQKNDTADQSMMDQDTVVKADKPSGDSANRSRLPYLTYYNDETNQFGVQENPEYIPTADIDDLLEAVGNKYPKVPLIIDHIGNDTLYIRIPNATYLTQSMGTSGATAFLVEATYGFTALQHIRVVTFDFNEGDHAIPGPYTRNSFSEFFK